MTLAADTDPRPEHAADRRGPLRPARLTPARMRLQRQGVIAGFRAGDALLLSTAAALVAGPIEEAAHLVIGIVAALATLTLFKTYALGAREGLALHLSRVASAMACGAGGGAMVFALPALEMDEPLYALWAGAAALLVLAGHAVWWAAVRRWRRQGRLTPNVVVVGATPAAERLIGAMLQKREVNILGVFDDRAARSPGRILGVPVLGDTTALVDHRIMPSVDRVLISVPSRARARIAELITRLRVLPNEVCLLLEEEDADAERLERIADAPLTAISGARLGQGRTLAKRGQDLVLAGLGMLVAAPVMLIVALAVRLDSPGPILFRQRRYGFNNEEIVVWKFRSMRVEASDAQAVRQVQADDDRVTRVGGFIRKTSLDELPQLFNVLSGEMSLVGPRPHAVGMRTAGAESARLVAEYAHRHRMKPGITGWAAIHGSRGPVDTPEAVRRRVALDVAYIERQSFWLDLYILAMTLPCLLGDRSAVR